MVKRMSSSRAIINGGTSLSINACTCLRPSGARCSMPVASKARNYRRVISRPSAETYDRLQVKCLGEEIEEVNAGNLIADFVERCEIARQRRRVAGNVGDAIGRDARK